MGGNIGVPFSIFRRPRTRVHVIECSSFQIDLRPRSTPSVGLLLNVTPDHLDRHGTLENYAAVKARLVAQADSRWSASTTSPRARSRAGCAAAGRG